MLRDNQVSKDDAAPVLREYQEAVTSLPDGHGKSSEYTWTEASTTLESVYSTPARSPEGKEKTPKLRERNRSVFGSMFNLGEVLEQEEKGWYLKDFLGPQELVMISGQPGSGKTFLVLDLCMSLALGRDWGNGKFPFQAPEPLRVAYFAGEGTGRLKKRVQALLAGHAVTPAEVGDRFTFFGGVPNLANLDDPNSVVQIVQEYRTRGLPFPQVIVVDTLARATPGSDENSARDAGMVIDALDYLKEQLDCSVIFVHHTGKDGVSERGSSALRGAVDALFKVVKPEKRGPYLTAEKLKDAEEFGEINFNLSVVTQFESCCIRWDGTKQADPALHFLRVHPGERLTLKALHDALGEGKSQATTRRRLDSLVGSKAIKTLETKGKPQVWWVEPNKDGVLHVDFSNVN